MEPYQYGEGDPLRGARSARNGRNMNIRIRVIRIGWDRRTESVAMKIGRRGTHFAEGFGSAKRGGCARGGWGDRTRPTRAS